jgi:hypothetical protein
MQAEVEAEAIIQVARPVMVALVEVAEVAAIIMLALVEWD